MDLDALLAQPLEPGPTPHAAHEDAHPYDVRPDGDGGSPTPAEAVLAALTAPMEPFAGLSEELLRATAVLDVLTLAGYRVVPAQDPAADLPD